MHIGLLTPDLTHGHGWGHYSLSLIQALCRAGIELTVITASNSPQIEGVNSIPILPPLVPSGRSTLLKMAQITPHVRQQLQACDLIHATAEPYAPLANWIAGKRPLVMTGHGSYVRLNKERHWPVSWLYERSFRRALTVCVSQYTERALKGAVPNARTLVVNNGIDAARFAQLPPLEGPKFSPVVLFVGAVKARKGVLELVRSMAVVRKHVPDVQCMIIGSLDPEPDYVQRIRQTIRELNLDGHVHLLGHVPENILLGWYGAADVFALPSMNDGWKFEGYGLAHLEASAAGLSVIGTSDCGAEDAIEDGITGILVSQVKVEDELPAAIIRLLTDKALAARLGAAGKTKAQTQTWDFVARQMIAVYQREAV